MKEKFASEKESIDNLLEDLKKLGFDENPEQCEGIPVIPSDLFKDATSFSDCFSGCTRLTTIPEGSFNILTINNKTIKI